MKKIGLYLIAGLCAVACNNPNPGESGAVNDGIHAVDKNGGEPDTTRTTTGPDTGKGEERTDISRRDTFRTGAPEAPHQAEQH